MTTTTISNDRDATSFEMFVLTAVQPNGRSITIGVFSKEEDGDKEADELKTSSNCTGFTLTPISFNLS